MNRLFFSRVLCLSAFVVPLLTAPDVWCQDPFSDDPFARPRPTWRSAEAESVAFRVVDSKGQPVAGVEIRGPGTGGSLKTAGDGQAIASLERNLLRRSAARRQGRIRFTAIPNPDLTMPATSKEIQLDRLLDTKRLEFKLVPGVRIEGSLIGADDKKPVGGLRVVASSSTGDHSRFRTTAVADKNGQWFATVPQAVSSVELTVAGIADGYFTSDRYGPSAKVTRRLSIPHDRSVVRAIDIEIQQLPKVPIRVVDSSGHPVDSASVRVIKPFWAENIGWWQSGSETELTNKEGECTLAVQEKSDEVTVEVFGKQGKVQLYARSRVTVPQSRTVANDIVALPFIRLGGNLVDGDSPAADVELVLYEAIQDPTGRWTSYGERGQATTDGEGHFVFDCPPGTHYLIATKQRDALGKQRVLFRSGQPVTKETRIPEIDLAKRANN